MSTDIIQADYECLEELARRFGEQAEAQSELHRRMAQAAAALQNGGWIGEGSAAFTQEMQGEIFPTMQRLTESLEQAKSVTLQVSEVVRQAEEEAARLFGGEGEVITKRNGDGVASYSPNESIPPPRIYIINGINSEGNVRGRIGDDQSVALEDLLESHGYDPNEVKSTSAIYKKPKGTSLSGTDLRGTNFGGIFKPLDWFTGGIASGVNSLTEKGANAINAFTNAVASNSIFSSAYGAYEVYTEYKNGEQGKYTQQIYNEISADLRDNPLAPNQTVIIMGHSGGGQVSSNVVGMLERNLDVDVSGLVTMGSPVANYDEAGRYATIVDVMHKNDRIGAPLNTPIIRSDEARIFSPIVLNSFIKNPLSVLNINPIQNPISQFAVLEAISRHVGDQPNVQQVTLTGRTSDAHGSYMHDPNGVSYEMLNRLNDIFPQMNLQLSMRAT